MHLVFGVHPHDGDDGNGWAGLSHRMKRLDQLLPAKAGIRHLSTQKAVAEWPFSVRHEAAETFGTSWHFADDTLN